MTVGEFHDATRRALDLARQHGSHPVQDAAELAETLAAAGCCSPPSPASCTPPPSRVCDTSRGAPPSGR